MSKDLVLGLGGTVDYEIMWDEAVVGALAREYDVRCEELSTDVPIVDERSLLVCLLAFVAAGHGGERFVERSQVVIDFAARFTMTVALGGTGVRAGIALHRLGIPSVQHLVSTGDHTRRLLPDSVRTISSAVRDSCDPHLIVQYPAGTTVQLNDNARLTDGAHLGGSEIMSPRPNRVILANDPPNRNLALAGELPDALAGAAVFLISGFNTMEDRDLLDARLSELECAMRRLPTEAIVYYEDAGFYHRAFADRVRDRLLPRIDVYGMNEDELQETLGRGVDLLDPGDVIEAMTGIRRLVPAACTLVHTAFWAIAVGPLARRYAPALDSGVRVAATRYRLGDHWSATDVTATDAWVRHCGGAAVVAGIRAALPDAAGAPGLLIETPVPTTIGLGDTFVGGFLSELAP